VDDAAAGGHPLHAAAAQQADVAHVVLMAHAPFDQMLSLAPYRNISYVDLIHAPSYQLHSVFEWQTGQRL
jgi:hypothetical protein